MEEDGRGYWVASRERALFIEESIEINEELSESTFTPSEVDHPILLSL